MARLMRIQFFFLLWQPLHALRDDVRDTNAALASHTEDADSSNSSRWGVTVKSLFSAGDACPTMATGTLVVGCISAQGLRKAEYFSDSDPYCRINVVDQRDMESRHWFGKKKAQIVSETMNSKTIGNNNDPEWKETFTIDVICPHVPEAYELEVNVMQDKAGKDSSLGEKKLPLKSLAGDVQKLREGVRQAFDLKGSKPKAQGTLNLYLKWCPKGESHQKCVSAALGDIGEEEEVKGFTSVKDCEMGCHSYLAEHLKEMTKKIRSKISSTRGHAMMETIADGMEAFADAMEDSHERQADHHDDWGDHAEDWGHHGADRHHQRLEDHHEREEKRWDDVGDTWDSIGDGAEASVKAAWKHVKAMSQGLKTSMQRKAEGICGPLVGQVIQLNVVPPSVSSKYSDWAASSVERALDGIDANVQQLVNNLRDEWEKGNTLPIRGLGEEPVVVARRSGWRHGTCFNHFAGGY